MSGLQAVVTDVRPATRAETAAPVPPRVPAPVAGLVTADPVRFLRDGLPAERRADARPLSVRRRRARDRYREHDR